MPLSVILLKGISYQSREIYILQVVSVSGARLRWGVISRIHVTTSHQIFITYKTTELSPMLSSMVINLGLLALFFTCRHFCFRVNLV